MIATLPAHPVATLGIDALLTLAWLVLWTVIVRVERQARRQRRRGGAR